MLVAYDGEQSAVISMCIPESIQVDEQLGRLIEHLWTELTWQRCYCSQTLAIGLQQVSTLLRDEASSHLAIMREAIASEHNSITKWAGSHLIHAQQELRMVEEHRYEFLYHHQTTHWT